MNQTEHFSSSIVNYEIANGILIASYKKGVFITLDLAMDNVKDRIKYTNDNQFPVLIKDYGVTRMDKDARVYLSSEDATKGIIAAAFVSGSVFSMFIINFFTKVNPPKMPVKAFSDELVALNWLSQFKSKT